MDADVYIQDIRKKMGNESDNSCVFVVGCRLTQQALFHLEYLLVHTLQLCLLEIHNKRIGIMFLIFFTFCSKRVTK